MIISACAEFALQQAENCFFDQSQTTNNAAFDANVDSPITINKVVTWTQINNGRLVTNDMPRA